MAMYTARDHTFVICAYKENPFLEDTIKSLKDQKVLGDIIVSTSTPNAYIEELCDRYSIAMIVNPLSRSAGDDWNYGYDSAKTPLVTIAHQDDYYAPEYLETVLSILNGYDHEVVSIVFTDYFEIRGTDRVTKNVLLGIKRVMNAPFKGKKTNGSSFVQRRILSFGNPICCPSAVFVKPITGPSVFDTTYRNSCDYKTWVNLASKTGRFVYIPNMLMGHRIYEGSATTKNIGNNIRKTEDMQILSSLWPKPLAWLINSIYSLSEKSNTLRNV